MEVGHKTWRQNQWPPTSGLRRFSLVQSPLSGGCGRISAFGFDLMLTQMANYSFALL